MRITYVHNRDDCNPTKEVEKRMAKMSLTLEVKFRFAREISVMNLKGQQEHSEPTRPHTQVVRYIIDYIIIYMIIYHILLKCSIAVFFQGI